MRKDTTITVGLDFGPQSVKVACVSTEDRRQKVLGLGAFSNEQPHDSDAPLTLEKAVGKNLMKWLSEREAVGCPAAVGVPMNHSALKWISLPKLPPDDFQSAARARARKELPFPVDQAYVSATQNTRTEGAEALVMAVEKKVINAYTANTKAVGLVPIHAEAEAQAIVRLIRRMSMERTAFASTASFTVVDIGFSNTRMYVVQDNNLRFARSIKFGSSNFVNRITQGLGISLEEASALLEDERAWLTSGGTLHLPYRDSHALVAADEELVILTREFQRLIRYFRSIFPARSFSGMLDSFLLCGGLSGLKGLSEFIGNAVQMKVSILDPLEHIDIDLSANIFHQTRKAPSRFAAAIGLALAVRPTNHSNQEDKDAFVWARVS